MLKTTTIQRRTTRRQAVAPGPSLRRLDWRFLLPAPPQGKFQHLRLYGGSPGLADLMVAANLAVRVTCADDTARTTDDERVDAVVILHDSAVDVAQAVRGLGPGGVFYQEIARRTPVALTRTPTRIGRTLRAAGLTPTGVYWAAPNFEQCKRMVPLAVPGIVQWYLATLFVAGTPLHAVVKTLLGWLAGQDNRRLGALVPCLAVTAVADGAAQGTDATPAVLDRPEVRGIVSQPDDRPRDAAEKPARLCPMLLTSGQDDASRLVMLPFQLDKDPAIRGAMVQPAAVIKVATHPRFNDETAREQCTLQAVRAQVDGALRGTIPEPYATFQQGDLVAAAQAVAQGRTLWASSGAWHSSMASKIDDLRLATRWLVDFHDQTEAKRIVWDQAAISRWVDAPLAAYTAMQVMTPAEAHLFERLRAYAATLPGATLPLAWQHHDFAPWNLYRHEDKLTVIDWEANRPQAETEAGPGLCDLLYFVVHWHNVAQRRYGLAAEVQGLHDLFIARRAKTAAIAAARQAIGSYMAARQIDRRLLPVLLVYTWIERVVYSGERGRKLGGGEARTGYAVAAPASSAATSKGVRYVQTLAAGAETLLRDGYADGWMG